MKWQNTSNVAILNGLKATAFEMAWKIQSNSVCKSYTWNKKLQVKTIDNSMPVLNNNVNSKQTKQNNKKIF